ncbi:MAG TPA: GspH/FimT family pseudopilin [Gemmataceae bacterium]|jgi:prepilin-type N-terminal cleavage/methylation domain-containing protein
MTDRRGFTLLEVLLVVAVIVILAAMAYPSIEAMYGDVRLSAAADQVRARWADARTKAIEEGRPYRFATQPDGQFRIAPDAADFWSGGGGSGASESNDADTPPLVVEESLPKGIGFSDETNNSGDNSDGGPWTTVLKFLPDGTASADKTITLQAEGYRSVQLRVRALTGAVTVETLPAGKSP